MKNGFTQRISSRSIVDNPYIFLLFFKTFLSLVFIDLAPILGQSVYTHAIELYNAVSDLVFSAPPEHVSTYCVTIALTFIYCTTQSFLNAILIISIKLYMYVALYKIDSPTVYSKRNC